MPAVTVVIPTRNRSALLTRAVASVRNQTLTDWQLILVDDASTDDTWEWISAQDDPRIVGHRITEWSERSAARNAGLARVEAPYVLFLDDDDELRADALAVLSAALDDTPAASVAVGSVHFVDPSGRGTPPMPKRRSVHNPWRELLAGWVAITGQMLMRTEVLRAVGGFRPDMPMAEDQELWLRLVAQERPAVFSPTVVLDHRPHRSEANAARGAEVERELRAACLDRAAHASKVARAIAAHERLRAADRAAQQEEFRRSAALYFSGLARCPELLVSPVIGAGLRRAAPVVFGLAILPKRTALAL
ncbi:MAG: glycosyltransferase family 2 protein, partial [Mycobacteriales bacterium]